MGSSCFFLSVLWVVHAFFVSAVLLICCPDISVTVDYTLKSNYLFVQAVEWVVDVLLIFWGTRHTLQCRFTDYLTVLILQYQYGVYIYFTDSLISVGCIFTILILWYQYGCMFTCLIL